MPAEEVTRLRNVAVVGQGGAGKTTVADALLFAAGASSRLGRVDDGSSAFDIEPEEVRRKSSITAGLHHAAWRKHELNLIDTPGYSAFLHDTRNCLRAATGAVLVLGPTGGEVKVEMEKVWGWCEELGLPRIAFVTRLDRERATIEHALEDLKAVGARPAVLQVPIGAEAEFKGVVDVLSGKAFLYQGESGAFQEGAPPPDLAAAVAREHERLVETIAEANDALLEKYLEGTELTADELRGGLREATHAGKILPVLCGAAGRAIGLHPLLDAIVDLLPSPADLPPWKGDNSKTGEEIERAADPAAPFAAYVFKTIVDPFAGKLAILRMVSGRIHADLNCVNTARDGRERIGHPLKLEGKKQQQIHSAVAGDVVAVAKLKETSSGDTLADEKSPIVFPPLPDAPAAISFALQPKSKADDEKVMQGLHRLMDEDTALRVHRQVKLYGGSYHDVDSSEMSFKIAAHLGFKKAFEMCKPVLLEPIMTITVLVPDEFMGDVIGDLNSRRGKVLGAQPKGNGQQEIRAHVPMAEVLRYAPDLRSMTSGRGDFELELSHYEETPPHIAEKIIKQAQAAKAERNA